MIIDNWGFKCTREARGSLDYWILILLTLVRRVQGSHALRIFKSKIACTRSCGQRMRFLLVAIRKIAVRAVTCEGESSRYHKQSRWESSKKHAFLPKAHLTRKGEEKKSIARARWTRLWYRLQDCCARKCRHLFSPLNNLSRSCERKEKKDRAEWKLIGTRKKVAKRAKSCTIIIIHPTLYA